MLLNSIVSLKEFDMICPELECRAWTEVKETRQRANGSTYRRYVCANNHRFTTKEVVVAKNIYESSK